MRDQSKKKPQISMQTSRPSRPDAPDPLFEVAIKQFLQDTTMSDQYKRKLHMSMRTSRHAGPEIPGPLFENAFKGEPVPYFSPLRAMIMTRSNSDRVAGIGNEDLEGQRRIAQQAIERCVGPVEVIQMCHEDDPTLEDPSYDEKILQYVSQVHILIIVGWDGFSVNQGSHYLIARSLQVNALVAWVFGKDKIFFLPQQRFIEYSLNRKPFAAYGKELISMHPFLEWGDVAEKHAYQRKGDVGRSDHLTTCIQLDQRDRDASRVDGPSTSADVMVTSVLIDPGQATLQPGQTLSGFLKHLMQDGYKEVVKVENPYDVALRTDPGVVLAFQDGVKVPSPLCYTDAQTIWAFPSDPTRFTLPLVQASFAKKHGGISKIREEQIARYWSLRDDQVERTNGRR